MLSRRSIFRSIGAALGALAGARAVVAEPAILAVPQGSPFLAPGMVAMFIEPKNDAGERQKVGYKVWSGTRWIPWHFPDAPIFDAGHPHPSTWANLAPLS
jgi:hypothetical protein